tara:strand:- start:197 stop:892 length:696 start_codon:yes stop_codon:yes gene_type:complete
MNLSVKIRTYCYDKFVKILKYSDENIKTSKYYFGATVSLLLFLLIGLVQLFQDPELLPEKRRNFIDVTTPPPPAFEEIPIEVEDIEPLEDLDMPPPPPITLDQLDVALNPGTGGSVSGDFALPTFDAKNANLGMDIFDIRDLDKIPGYRDPLNIRYPEKAKRMGLEGNVKVQFTVDLDGKVEALEIIYASNKIFIPGVKEAFSRVIFHTGEKNGRSVKFKMAQNIPFTLSN